MFDKKQQATKKHKNLKKQLTDEIPSEILDTFSTSQLEKCAEIKDNDSLTDDEKFVMCMSIADY